MRAPDLGIPAPLDAVCVKATAFLAADRYASARDMVADLERFLEGDRDLARNSELAGKHAALAEATSQVQMR